MPTADSFSLPTFAPHLFAETLGHIHFKGDSQATYNGAPPNNYWVSNGFLYALPLRWDYFVAQTTNSSANVPARASISGTGVSMNNISSLRSVADYPSYGGVQWHDTSRIAFASDLAANTVCGNGFVMNQRGVSGAVASTAFSWPTIGDTGLPWYHGSHLRGALVYLDHSNAPLLKFGIDMSRVGATTNAAAGFQVDITGASRTGGLLVTQFTPALADAGTYNTAGGANYSNDHEVRVRLYASSDAAYNESGLSLMPVSTIIARSNSGGVYTTKPDGSRLGFSCSGRAGSFVSDWLNYANTTQTRNYFATVASLQGQSGTRRRFTLVYMFGHNADVSELSGDAYTTTFRDNYIALIERDKNAILAEWPDAEVLVLVLVPWRSIEAGANSNEARSRSLHARCVEVAQATSADWLSFAAMTNHRPFMYPLHPQEYASGTRLASMLTIASELQVAKNTFYRPR